MLRKKRIEDLEQELKILAVFRKIRTMKERYRRDPMQVQAAMRRHYLRPNGTVCMCALQRAQPLGKLSLSASVEKESAAFKEVVFHDYRQGAYSKMEVRERCPPCTAVCRRPSPADVSIPRPRRLP